MAKGWRIALIVSLLGTVVTWFHQALTHVGPPTLSTMDLAVWGLASICKIATIVCIPFALSRAFSVCAGNKTNAVRAAIVWAIAGIVLLGILTATREQLSRFLNNDATRFYPISSQSPTMKSPYNEGLQPFMVRWQSGVIVAEEAGCVLLAAIGLGLLGYYLGRGGYRAGMVGAAWLVAVVLMGGFSLGLMCGDYDFFFAGTLIGPVSLDVVIPYIATDPETEIAFLAYTCLIVSSLLIEQRLSPRKFRSEKETIADPAFEP